MEVYHLQYVFMCVLFISTLVVGLVPVLLKNTCSKKINLTTTTKSRILSCASCVGAGVFLFVCFMGLLPEADSKFHKILEELEKEDPSWHKFSEFPWGFFVVTCGFLVIFTIDKLVHAIEETKVQKSDQPVKYLEIPSHIVSKTSLQIGDGKDGELEKSLYLYCEDSCSSNEGHGVPSSVMFLIALGIHSVVEGVAVGLQTEREKVLEFSVAVLVHELVMAFTFGLEVSKSKSLTTFMKVIYVTLFGISIPLGIAMGVALQRTPNDNREIVAAICEAFATGIFLHVIFIEVLAQEFPGHKHHNHMAPEEPDPDTNPPPSEIKILLQKIFCIIIGLLIMILLSVFMHSNH